MFGVESGEFFFFLAREGCVVWGGQIVVWMCGRVGGGDHVDGVGDPAGVLVGGDGSAVGVGVGELFGGQVQQVARRPPLGVGGGDRGDQSGQAGSAATVSAIAEPNTAWRSLIQGGRILALGVSRVAVWLILPDSRHHSAAAGSSSGSGCSDAASTTRWARSGRLGAAWARCSANCGQKLSLRMRGSMESMS